MPHTISVSKTITTSSSSGIFINTGFLKKIPGIVKICELVIGIICIALCAHYTTQRDHHVMRRIECYFLTTAVTFFTGTFLIVLSSMASLATETLLKQTLFEPMYHSFGFLLYFAAGVGLVAQTTGYLAVEGLLAAGSLGIINSILYAVLGVACQNLLMSSGSAFSLSLGSPYYSLLMAASSGTTTSVALLFTYVVSGKSAQLVRQSCFEIILGGLLFFLYISSSCYLAFAAHTFLYPIYKITSLFQTYPAMSLTYVTGFLVGILHGYDGWLAYRKYH